MSEKGGGSVLCETEVRIGDEIFKVRGLKRREIKTLKEKGVNLAIMTSENSDSSMEEVTKLVFGEDRRIDDLFEKEYYYLFKKILDLTYLSPDEIKNLQ